MDKSGLSPTEAARQAHALVKTAQTGALATVRRAARNEGHPYVSRVGVAFDAVGAPVFLLSTLAAHTQDLLKDPRASLMIEGHAKGDNPLDVARVTFMGRVEKASAADLRDLYLATHSQAQQYVDFGDFSFWRMDLEKVHVVGGFGQAKWLKAQDYLTAN